VAKKPATPPAKKPKAKAAPAPKPIDPAVLREMRDLLQRLAWLLAERLAPSSPLPALAYAGAPQPRPQDPARAHAEAVERVRAETLAAIDAEYYSSGASSRGTSLNGWRAMRQHDSDTAKRTGRRRA
jgi:hypothetical protein